MSRQLYTMLFTLGIVLSSHGMQLPDDIKNTTSNFFDGPSALKTEAEDLFHPADRFLMEQTDYTISPIAQRRTEIQINAYVNDKRTRITNRVRIADITTIITPSLSVFNSKLYPIGAIAPIPANEA